MAQTAPALATPLCLTPLYSLHVASGARMVDFAGWLMPVQYQSILAEHAAVRSAVGLFDLSHMARLRLRGPRALDVAQRLTTNDVSRLAAGQAQYSLVCNPLGGIRDDVVVYNLGHELLIIANAANRAKIVSCLRELIRDIGGDVEFEDATESLAMIGVQGPKSEELLQPLTQTDLGQLGYYRAMTTTVDGYQALVARTGYTGEDGFELIVPAEQAEPLWNRLASLSAPVAPRGCGLGSRDTLRLEAGMPLYGHELDEETDPFEAGLGRVVHLEKGDFVGREALQRLCARGPDKRLVGFELLEPGVPRGGYSVVHHAQVVGSVTSGIHSPSLQKGIGFAYLPATYAHPGEQVSVQVRERQVRANLVPTPFLPHRTRARS